MATITSLSCGPQGTNQGNTGQTLIINGVNLAGATSARFGGRTVAATVNGAGTQVTCTVPKGRGVRGVTVTTAGGTSNALPFYYTAPPVVSGVTPAVRPAAGPGPVVITGRALLTADQVSFNGVPAAAAPVVTGDGRITVTPDPIPPVGAHPWFQHVSLTVRTAGGTATVPHALVAYDTPEITSLTHAEGAAGTQVVMHGRAFVSDDIQVTFAGVPADFTARSDTRLAATVPAGPTGTVHVVVTTPGGSSAPAAFTYA